MKRPAIGLNIDFREKKDAPTYRIKSDYVDAVYEAGGIPLLIPSIPDKSLLKEYVSKCDAFILTGGKDYPPEYYGETRHSKTNILPKNRSETDFILSTLLLKTSKTVLGICAGHQLLNIVLGGKLIQHIDGHSDDIYHKVKIGKDSKILRDIFGKTEILVNSSHHQAINPKYIGKGLTTAAVSEDGVIEAVEHRGKQMILGIQWHPERIKFPEHRNKIFKWLVEKASIR
ncbi:MAG: gamma-glutamyl-gamma-aminobutyrate hydrolase family protein [Victivallales bacterium]